MDVLKKFDTGFAQIPNVVLCDPNLSERAKGVYAYLVSKPDGWEFRKEVISRELKCSKNVFRTIVAELTTAKYVIPHQTTQPDGKFGPMVYEFVNPTTVDEKTPCRDFYRIGENRYTVTEEKERTKEKEGYTSNTESPPIVPPRGPSDGQSESDSDRTVREAVEQFEQRWNSELCKDCPFIARIIAFNDSRRKQVKARLKEAMKIRDRLKLDKPLLDFVFDDIIRYRCSNSDFLQGKVEPVPGRSKFRFSIDHFCRPSFFANLVDGKYTS